MKKRDKSWYSAERWAEIQAEEGKRTDDDRICGFKAAGVEWVEWLTAGTGDSCRHCAAMDGKVMRLSELKFTTHPKCEHEDGCRCVLIAVSGPG